MDIKAGLVLIPYAVSSYVGLIRNDQGRRNGVHGPSGGFVMVSNGGYHRNPVLQGQVCSG